MLTSEEAARRLGVKVPDALRLREPGAPRVSSGPGPAGSLFDLDEVEALATRSRGGRQTATRLATITTGVTQLDQSSAPSTGATGHRAGRGGELRGRGRDALAVRGRRGLAGARPRSVPADRHARPHAVGRGHVWGDRSAPLRSSPGRGGPAPPVGLTAALTEWLVGPHLAGGLRASIATRLPPRSHPGRDDGRCPRPR